MNIFIVYELKVLSKGDASFFVERSLTPGTLEPFASSKSLNSDGEQISGLPGSKIELKIWTITTKYKYWLFDMRKLKQLFII
mmetsp:Transcript_29417/g.53883  ORF Transcript_29417/g.53883 Transcript_29417/m.53883 type:complete len:82 (+) Transcript_29417:2959-3204(+)